MKNRKIDIDKKPLTTEDIKSGMDFNRVLTSANKIKHPYKKWYWISGVVVTISAIVFSLFFLLENKPPFINPPFKGIDIAKTDYKILIDDIADTIIHPSGTKIIIPPCAIVNKDGSKVNGEVNLHYREFMSIEDIIISGIPMTYDSAQTKWHFESASMFEINAYMNGKELAINKNCIIEIELATPDKDFNYNTNYNIYYLDTLKGKWKYLMPENNEGLNGLDFGSVQYRWLRDLYNEKLKEAQNEKERIEFTKELEIIERSIIYHDSILKTFSKFDPDLYYYERKFKQFFSVANFGIYNSDAPHMLPIGESIIAKYINETGKRINPFKIFLIENKDKKIVTYEPNEVVFYNPSLKNTLILIIDEKTLAFVSNKEMKKIPTGSKEHTFTIKEIKAGKSVDKIIAKFLY